MFVSGLNEMKKMRLLMTGLLICFSIQPTYSIASYIEDDPRDLHVTRSVSKSFWPLFSGLNWLPFGKPKEQIQQASPIFLMGGDIIIYLSESMSTQELARLARTCKTFNYRINRLPFAPAKFTPMLKVIIDDEVSNSSQELENFIQSYGLRSVVGLRSFVQSAGDEDWTSRFCGAVNIRYTLTPA